jgi:thiol:disulfide interchange protein DsbA
MRLLRLAAACLLAAAVATPAFASPANPQNGVDYVTLAQPQPVQAAGKKVEVIEFFMYHCPVCNGLEAGFEEWVKKQGAAIVDWVSKNGIDRTAFLNAWNSFGVTVKLHQLDKVIAAYKVESVPTIVVDGRYVTSPAMAHDSAKANTPQEMFQATLQIADALVAKAAGK